MYKVLILMSTYNGKGRIQKQVDSIMQQKQVESYLYIRDDGSDKDTIEEIKQLSQKYKERIFTSFENNVGWKRSFLKLIYAVDNTYDYYGFSDQDDIWLESKVINCIRTAEMDNYIGPKLIHCNSLSVTPDLRPRNEQENRRAEPPSFKAVIATEYFQGCGMLWNNSLMNIIQSYCPINENLSHDYWVGLMGYLFGKIYFVKESLFYHIRYENNSSEDGNRNKGRIRRVKNLVTGKETYMNPAQDLLNGYIEQLPQEYIFFLRKILDYKFNLQHKIDILFDRQFRRPSISATLVLKFTVLLNRF